MLKICLVAVFCSLELLYQFNYLLYHFIISVNLGVQVGFWSHDELHSGEVWAFFVSVTPVVYSVPNRKFFIPHLPPNLPPFCVSSVHYTTLYAPENLQLSFYL